MFSGNAYFRYIRADTVNPNLNATSADESVYQPTAADQAALAAAGYTGFPTSGANASNTPFPYWRCIAETLQLIEPIEKCDAVIIRSFTKQNNYGVSWQLTWSTSRGDHRNQFTVGSGWYSSSLTFQQGRQSVLNPDYTITPVNGFEDGSTNQNGAPVDTRVYLHGLPQTWSIYATDTLSIGNAWSFAVSGRYSRATIDNRDRIDPGGGPSSLDGLMAPPIRCTESPTTRRQITLFACLISGFPRVRPSKPRMAISSTTVYKPPFGNGFRKGLRSRRRTLGAGRLLQTILQAAIRTTSDSSTA